MNLFSEDPQFKVAQYQKLSDNVSEWQEQIVGLVSEAIPRELNLDSVVKFQKIDEEKGYGVGSVILRDSSTGNSVGVPIIVKAWHLAPLDLFFKDDIVMPLNEENLSRSFYNPGLGAGLAPQKRPPQLSDDGSVDTRYPPMGGKYSYASVSDFVDDLEGTTLEVDVSKFKQAVFSQPNVLAKIARSGLTEHFNKFAEKVTNLSSKADADDRVDKLRAVRTLTIKKNGPNKYKLFANAHNLFDPVIIDSDRKSLCSFLGTQEAKFDSHVDDVMNDVDKNGETTLKAPPSPWGKEVLLDEEGNIPHGSGSPTIGIGGGVLGVQGSPFVFDPKGDKRGVVQADKFGQYCVRDADGVISKGFVIPNIVNFDGSVVKEKLFLSGALSAFQNRIAGIPFKDQGNAKLPGGIPETGKVGVLVFQDGEKVFSTVPFQVVGISLNGSTRVIDYKGEKMNLIFSRTADGIIGMGDSKMLGSSHRHGKSYMVSDRMTFVPMGKMSPVSESSDAFLKKASTEMLDPSKLTVSKANGRFVFRGNAIRKYAEAHSDKFDFQTLDRHEASFLLHAWGLGAEKTASVLDGIEDRISLEVHGLNWMPVKHREKVASVDMDEVIGSFKPCMEEVVKIASMLDNADSVDSVLALGFINKENLERFSGAVPNIKIVIGTISKLLLASRLGMSVIPEDAAKGALTHLEDVVAGVLKVKMMRDSGEVKTSSALGRFAAAL